MSPRGPVGAVAAAALAALVAAFAGAPTALADTAPPSVVVAVCEPDAVVFVLVVGSYAEADCDGGCSAPITSILIVGSHNRVCSGATGPLA